MPEEDIPSPEELIAAYVAAETLPDFLPPADVDRIRGQRRKAALAALQKIRGSAEEADLVMHHAYRPEVTTEVSVPLSEGADCELAAAFDTDPTPDQSAPRKD